MTKVISSAEVENYLFSLMRILYDKEYFGFEDSANKYVEGLIKDIRVNLPRKVRKLAPPHFNKYGKGLYYATFRKSKRTQWYVFYQVYRQNEELVYLIRYIDNNHNTAHLL
ncbi:MAG: hypothetical protein LBN24_02650 [Mediterranea sp.]|jgi:hypothetical protein|nr:hypothetical protein [Mediterranea sp.]